MPREEHREVDYESKLQYDTSLFSNARLAVTEHAYPPIGVMDPSSPETSNWGIEGEMIRVLGIKGDESIADIGCGDGRFVKRLLLKGHTGSLLAINNTSGPYLPADLELSPKYPNVRFVKSDARDLRMPDGEKIPDESLDIVTSNHTYYHIADYETALQEVYRVLKPGGIHLISTRGVDHQSELWRFTGEVTKDLEARIHRGEIDVESLIGSSPHEAPQDWADQDGLIQGVRIIAPESFYSHFDFEVEREVVPKFFTDDERSVRQFDHARLGSEDWDTYSLAVSTSRTSCIVQVGDKRYYMISGGGLFNSSINAVVKPEFLSEIRRKGYFTEFIWEGFDIWRKAA